jgi:hypothetical protein
MHIKENRLETILEYSRQSVIHRTAFIYTAGFSHYVKIGIANDLGQRIKSLQTGCPFEIQLYGAFPTREAMNDERIIHRKFRPFWLRG